MTLPPRRRRFARPGCRAFWPTASPPAAKPGDRRNVFRFPAYENRKTFRLSPGLHCVHAPCSRPVSAYRFRRFRPVDSILRLPQGVAPDHAPKFLRHGARRRWRAATSLLGCSAVARRRSGRAARPPRYDEPALKITRENGSRDLVLRYASHRISGDDLDIVLKDLNDAIEVTLHYRVYPDYGILRRSATIRNATPRPLTVESAQSATWNLPPGEGYQLTYLSGRWAAETQVNREPIHEGQKVLESRKGHTSHNFNPW